MVQQNIRILIADDHAVVREGLKQFLAETPGFEIGGEAGNAREALAKVREGRWDLVLLDISMPDKSGIDVLKEIKLESPHLPVLVFSMFSEDEYALSTLQWGASGFVTKGSAPEQLIEAIRRVVQGGKYVSSTLAEKLLAQTLPQRAPLAHELLSKREFEILLCISKGLPLTRIGEGLHLSVKTVSTYRSRILEKLGFSTNAELTRYVIEHRLDQ